jgi:hypothetical protein
MSGKINKEINKEIDKEIHKQLSEGLTDEDKAMAKNIGNELLLMLNAQDALDELTISLGIARIEVGLPIKGEEDE